MNIIWCLLYSFYCQMSYYFGIAIRRALDTYRKSDDLVYNKNIIDLTTGNILTISHISNVLWRFYYFVVLCCMEIPPDFLFTNNQTYCHFYWCLPCTDWKPTHKHMVACHCLMKNVQFLTDSDTFGVMDWYFSFRPVVDMDEVLKVKLRV